MNPQSSASSRRRLVIFCRKAYSGERADGSWHWGPNAKAHGIGGSESAVISISAQLAALGWGVEVYANPSLADTGRDASGVLWLPHWAYELDGELEGEIAGDLGEIDGDLGEIDETPRVGQLATPRRHLVRVRVRVRLRAS